MCTIHTSGTDVACVLASVKLQFLQHATSSWIILLLQYNIQANRTNNKSSIISKLMKAVDAWIVILPARKRKKKNERQCFLLSAANLARAILQSAGTISFKRANACSIVGELEQTYILLGCGGENLQFNLCGIAQCELASASHTNINFTPACVAGEQKAKRGRREACA